MAELQTLFHNPESLSDTDLRSIKAKCAMMGRMKYMGALSLGAGRYFYVTKVLGKAKPCWFTISLFTAAGYCIGGS